METMRLHYYKGLVLCNLLVLSLHHIEDIIYHCSFLELCDLTVRAKVHLSYDIARTL